MTAAILEFLQRQKKGGKLYTKQECRRALADLKTAPKLPPRRLSKADFQTEFKLSSKGKNPHKLKIGKHIPAEEVEAVFGTEKGRNGYSLGDKLSDDDRQQVEVLYCVCYQKEFAPNYVAKELAIGWVFQEVRGEDVDWAQFAAETNQLQQANYRVRVTTWLKRLKALGENDVDVERDLHDFLEGTSAAAVKLSTSGAFKRPPPISMPNDVKNPRKSSSMMPSFDFDMLASRFFSLSTSIHVLVFPLPFPSLS